jgi:trimeric autotransporter adhesin
MKIRFKIFTIILSALACFGLFSRAQAQNDEGDVGNGNTVEGFHALANGSDGAFNTALGWFSLGFNGVFGPAGLGNTGVGAGTLDLAGGNFNTAAGTGALLLNFTTSQNTAVGFEALLFNDNLANGSAEDNTAVGFQALLNNIDAANNTAVGSTALFNNDSSGNGTANFNTAVGSGALEANVNGGGNTAVGVDALSSNTTSFLTAIGVDALFDNTTGLRNTAVGSFSLNSNHTADDNTAVGQSALGNNDSSNNGTANGNTAVGTNALRANVDGAGNTALGFQALAANIGGANVAVGENAAAANTNGAVNTAVGSLALTTNTTGTENTAVGRRALENLNGGHENTAVGWGAGANYTGIEFNNICIGDQTAGVAGEDDTIRIGEHSTSNGIVVKPQQTGGPPLTNTILIGTGNHSQGISVTELLGIGTIQIGRGLNPGNSSTFIGGIAGFVQPEAGTAEGVTIETNAASANFQRLGREASSRRYKEDIKPLDKLSEAVFKLKPVTYRIKKEINPAQPTGFGLIAEDVAEANPDLVVYNSEGQPESVHYKQVDVMLLNEFLKEHKKVEEQQATITQLKKDFGATIAQLTARLDEQAAQIQKVSAQLEMSKPAPQVVVNKP